MKLGIIGAMQVEVDLLKAHMQEMAISTHADMEFCQGRLDGLDAVVVQCGVGKVNAAMCAQILCSLYGATHLINTGIAGSLNPKLDIGDLVVSEDAMYHDFDCVHFGYEMGKVPGMDVVAFPADPKLICLACQAAEAVNPSHWKTGRVASGDLFVAQKQAKEAIIAKTGALCTEMEGAAIAHVCHRNQIPFVILRAISDKADDSAEMDYPTFERIAAHRCAQITQTMAKLLADS